MKPIYHDGYRLDEFVVNDDESVEENVDDYQLDEEDLKVTVKSAPKKFSFCKPDVGQVAAEIEQELGPETEDDERASDVSQWLPTDAEMIGSENSECEPVENKESKKRKRQIADQKSNTSNRAVKYSRVEQNQVEENRRTETTAKKAKRSKNLKAYFPVSKPFAAYHGKEAAIVLRSQADSPTNTVASKRKAGEVSSDATWDFEAAPLTKRRSAHRY